MYVVINTCARLPKHRVQRTETLGRSQDGRWDWNTNMSHSSKMSWMVAVSNFVSCNIKVSFPASINTSWIASHSP